MSYFVFEGVDGVGKTTVMKAVATRLLALGKQIVLTKEPGGPKALADEWGHMPLPLAASMGMPYQNFRALCVNNMQIPQKVKRALYLADSFYNWESVVEPALAEGKIVLSDRSWVSDLAYGSTLAGASFEALRQFNSSLLPLRESLTNVIWLHAPEDVREERLKKSLVDGMDKLGKEVRNEIANNYDYLLVEPNWLKLSVKQVNTAGLVEEFTEEIVNWIIAQ